MNKQELLTQEKVTKCNIKLLNTRKLMKNIMNEQAFLTQ
jgi:hypothetical protein